MAGREEEEVVVDMGRRLPGCRSISEGIAEDEGVDGKMGREGDGRDLERR